MKLIRSSMSDFPFMLISLKSWVSSNILERRNCCSKFSRLYPRILSPLEDCFLGILWKGFFTKILVLLSKWSIWSLLSLLLFFTIKFFYSFYISIEFSLSIFRVLIVLLMFDFRIFFSGIRSNLGFFKYCMF